MRKTITIDLGETNELDQFLDEYVLDEMRGAINDLDLSEITIAHMQKLLDKTKRHFRSQIVETENADAEPAKHEECEYVITKGKAGYREEYKCSACGDSFYWSQDRTIPRSFNYCRNCGRKVIRFIEKEVNTIRRESE